MTTTSAQERLNRLFENSPRPPLPTLGQPHFSEVELEEKRLKDEQPRKSQFTAEYPRQIKSLQKMQPDRDILTSSDDDYASLFSKKPSMKPVKKTQSKSRKMHESNASSYPEDPAHDPKGPVEYLAKGKWSKQKASRTADDLSDSDDGMHPSGDGDGNSVVGRYCQFNLAAKFPYKYMNDPNDRVSRHFFAANKFYNRKWDVYFIHPPFSLGGKPIVLVPYEQVQQLLTEIGETFNLSLSVPKFPFTLTFFSDGTPQPIFLGKSSSKDEANNLQNDIPAAPFDYGECPDSASEKVRHGFEDFKSKCQEAMLARGKNKGGSSKKRRDNDRLLSIKDWYVQLRRAQRYLGLRQKTGHIQHPDPGLSWEEQEKVRQRRLKEAHFVLNPLDLSSPAPFPFEKEPVIISIDVESYERAHNLITEIGVSTLDTLDMVGVSPGPNGQNWLDKIRSRHFRISGRENLVNRDFCIGHPDAFQFGKSEWVDLKEAGPAVDACFQWPFSVKFQHASLRDEWGVEPVKENGSSQRRVSSQFGGVSIGPTNAEQDAASRTAMNSVLTGIGNKEAIQKAVELMKANRSDPENLQQGSKTRNIIIVGHDIRTDIDYLKDLGSKIFTSSRNTYPVSGMDMMASDAWILASIMDSMDTAPLYCVLKEETQNRSLSSIMSDLGLPCYFPHNGGNDARYTLEAWVAMLIKARQKGDKEQQQEDKRMEASLKAAKENDSWNQGSGWGEKPVEVGNDKREECLDTFEAAIMAPSPPTSPPREKDEATMAMAKNLRLDPRIDHEEPKSRLG